MRQRFVQGSVLRALMGLQLRTPVLSESLWQPTETFVFHHTALLIYLDFTYCIVNRLVSGVSLVTVMCQPARTPRSEAINRLRVAIAHIVFGQSPVSSSFM